MPAQTPKLITAIKDEHQHLGNRLHILKQELRAWSKGKEPNTALLRLLVRFFETFPDEIHHKKEDMIYDALIEKGVLESAYLKRLRGEHDEMAELTSAFSKNLKDFVENRKGAADKLIDKLNRFIDMQEVHMADEESQFLPLAESELSGRKFARLQSAIRQALITDEAKRVFHKLADIDTKIEEVLRNRG